MLLGIIRQHSPTNKNPTCCWRATLAVYSKVSTALAFLHSGHNLYFKHEDGAQEELTVDSFTFVESYGLSNKTCDFVLDFKSHSSCLGSGLCWNSVNCHQGARLQAVGAKAYSLHKYQVGCRLVPNMDDPCTCSYYSKH